MIDKAIVTTQIGGLNYTDTFDTPNVDCTRKIKDFVNRFFDIAGVNDRLTITVKECDD